MATEKTQKMFLDAMKKKFAEDPTSNTTTYKREGYTQSKDKREFQEWGAKIAKDRGIPAYNVNVHLGGMTLGQRQLMPYNVSGTDVMCEGDDLHYVNNPAMQQMWDEIRRTVIVGLDQAHETPEHLVCRLLLEKKKNTISNQDPIDLAFINLRAQQNLNTDLFVQKSVVPVDATTRKTETTVQKDNIEFK